LVWFERTLHTLREGEEIGSGEHECVDAGPPNVLVHRATRRDRSMLFVHNLANHPERVGVRAQLGGELQPLSYIADSNYGEDIDLDAIDVAGYGYRWIRLHHPG
jgi:maltose alpha-D-glucosyltransferase/alpha-amylase